MVFHRQQLLVTDTLGDRLRQVRESAGQTVDQIAKQISIQPKYLTALEEGNYRALPGPVYARSFSKKYAEALGLDIASVMELFDKEYQIITSGKVERHLPSQRVSTDHHWLRRNGRFVIAGIVVIGVLAYFGAQVVRLLTPPPLTITQPAKDVSITQLHITVAGVTDPTATVTINTQPVELGSNGHFEESIDVSPGLNTLNITAQKKHSRPRVVTRQVLVEITSQ